jgi:carbon-monoxide dehydrogenase large subunit
MLHMAILRSPYAHATINGIDASKAQALPGVIAVVTGELMAQHNLAWMPTLSGDTQAVLATDKVRFQGQEVAAVVATDQYIAVDALELIDVDYGPLDPITTPQQALEDGAPLIRTDKEGQENNHVYSWETGNKEATDLAFSQADVVVSLDTHYPRIHPAPLETCGCIADISPATGQATIYMTSQAPHLIRTVFALVADCRRRRSGSSPPTSAADSATRCRCYPAYVVATAASLLLGTRSSGSSPASENLISTGFARDYPHAWRARAEERRHDARPACVVAGRRRRVLRRRAASKFKAGLFTIVSGSYDLPGDHVTAEGRVHEQGARRGRVPMLVPRDGGLVPDRAPGFERRVRAGHGSRRPAEEELHQEGQFPYTSSTGFVYDSGDYEGAMDRRST